MKKFGIFIISFVCSIQLFAQPKIADKIVAQVGANIILKSDIEAVYQQDLQQSVQNGGSLSEEYRCTLMQQFISQKLLLIQAEKDSVVITDEQVEYELDRRIRYFETMFGTREKMEDFYGKTVQEMKEEFRGDIRDQLLVDEMRRNLFGDISISPSEVRAFYNSIPKDSLPYFNAEVEISQIVLIPQPSQEQKDYAKEKIQELLDRIKNGDDFSLLANSYSNDPGSNQNGGDLGCVTRGTFVPEFDAVAFKLKPGEVSDIVQTQFGYHIIKLISRQGDNVCLKHILIAPPVTTSSVTKANQKLDSIRTQIVSGKLTFYNAAVQYSMDQYTSMNGGDIKNQKSGDTYFEINDLEPEVYYAIEKLKPGEVTQVMPYTTLDGKKAVRILLLKTQSSPHIASLEDDYYRMQQAAMNKKREDQMNKWMEEKIKTIYVKIDPSYLPCDNLTELISMNKSTH